jgi:predicted ATPase/DNA-binding SARP family transcriptional activator
VAGRQAVEIRILGPLAIVGEEGAIALPAAKLRQLLAALVVDAGTIRSSDFLLEALWGASPPPSAAKLLQVYVSKLRRLLPGPARIATHGSGYALEVGDGLVDAARFERLLGEGRVALREGNPALAAATLRRALSLWRGAAFGELAYDEFARAEAERLEELRLVATEERIGAELELGLQVELLPELHSLAAAHPLRERVQAQIMLALYRSGRQAEALERYDLTRRRLDDELGLEPNTELRELQRRILQHDPALAAPPAVEHVPAVLPAAPNPLRGRERELADLRELLRHDDVRLLVLTGAGGSGKTRLALEAARSSAASFANGAAFVGLAPLRDPGLLATTIASALGILQPAGEPLETLAAALAPKELLLVVDNVEHLRPATPLFVELVARAPRLTLLVTSRVVLHLSGEHVYPVDPLGPDEAAALFLERARGADARFTPEARDEDAIRRLCARVDGLPLAIELAAARSRTLTPAELLERLEARLPILTGGPHDLPARQQTLRATLDWSFRLLDDGEQRDLARLSVFVGGCTAAAAEAVCDTSFERLASLVDHSLLLRTVGPLGSRYSMLETVREFASERRDASGEAPELHRRQAAHALLLAESLGLSVEELGTRARQRHDVAREEQANMRAALDWALDSDPELGLRLALALEQFWVSTVPREGMQRIAALLERADEIPPELRARALRDLGGSTEISGDAEQAARYYRHSLELYEQLADEAGQIRLQRRLANTMLASGDRAGAIELVQQALARARAGGFRFEESELLDTLSVAEFEGGNVETAYDLVLRSLKLGRELGAWPWGESIKLLNIAEFAIELGRVEDAEAPCLEALALSREIGSRINTVYALAVLAMAARARGDDDRAGRLWGAIEAEEARTFLGYWADYREQYAGKVLVPASAKLESALGTGRRLPLDEATAYAFGGPAGE